MNKVDTTAPEANKSLAFGQTSLLEILIILARHKRVILGFPALAACLSAPVTFALPDIYRATATLLPPQQSQSSAAALLSQLGSFASVAGATAGLKNPNDMYVGMLESRTVADRLIAQFNLKREYGVTLQEKARLKLDDRTSITARKDGLITIEVEDESRERVAQMANGYVNELLRLTKILAVTEASQRRVFFERQLEQSKNNLAVAESALKSALDVGGVISVDADSRAVVETVGRLRAQISAKEIQLRSMQAFVTTQNSQYQRAQEELNSLRAQLTKLENGQSNGNATTDSSKVGLQNIKILRDVKYHQMLYELLAKQYEVARLDEAKDPAIVQVLDPAVVPERKVKPKRAVIVLITTALAFLITVSFVVLREAKRRAMRYPKTAAKIAELRSHLRFR